MQGQSLGVPSLACMHAREFESPRTCHDGCEGRAWACHHSHACMHMREFESPRPHQDGCEGRAWVCHHSHACMRASLRAYAPVRMEATTVPESIMQRAISAPGWTLLPFSTAARRRASRQGGQSCCTSERLRAGMQAQAKHLSALWRVLPSRLRLCAGAGVCQHEHMHAPRARCAGQGKTGEAVATRT